MSEKRKNLFDRGYKVAKAKDDAIEEKKKSLVGRFFMKPEESKRIIFLDDSPVMIEEHQVWEDGRPKFFTCLKMFDESCPLCKRKHKPSSVGYYSIIDRSEWKDKQGKSHKNERKLFGAKMKALRKLRRLSKECNGLDGVEFKVYRDGSDDPTTGSDFTQIKKHELEYLLSKGLEAEPFDYDVILAPKDESEYEEVDFVEYGKGKNLGSKKSGKNDQDEEVEEDQDDEVDF